MILLLLLVFCLMFPLRAAGYNPLQANCENRILDILAETNRVDVLLLAGTCEPHKGGITTSCIEGRTIISSGFTCTSMSNKCCGISIIVGKAHRKARFHDPVEISGKAKGRGLSQKVQSGRIDVNCISAYFPPLPRKKLSTHCIVPPAKRLPPGLTNDSATHLDLALQLSMLTSMTVWGCRWRMEPGSESKQKPSLHLQYDRKNSLAVQENCSDKFLIFMDCVQFRPGGIPDQPSLETIRKA